jgi:DNA mismatch endonuclease (patch repair protein)
MDKLTPEKRSRLMSRVRGRDTKPELAVRRMLHMMGFRYRLHRGDLPGRPDIVFVSRKKVIFVHGCFWHGHRCARGKLPTTNTDFWRDKIGRNMIRDHKSLRQLRKMGWSALVVWECTLKNSVATQRRIVDFLR